MGLPPSKWLISGKSTFFCRFCQKSPFVGQEGLDTFHLEKITHNQYQSELSEANVPAPMQFLQHLAEDQKFHKETTMEYTSVKMMQMFEAWKEPRKIKYEADVKKLLRNLKVQRVPNWYETHKGRSANTTIVNFEALRSHFGVVVGLAESLRAAAAEDDEGNTDSIGRSEETEYDLEEV